MTRVRRALLSVHDKSGLARLARGLADLGVELVSTGGTARALREAGLAVREVSELTGSAEMLDGRVKTLHPKVHGAILFRRDDPDHVRQAESAGLAPIDLVVVNLYPFERTVARAGVTREEAVEEIDVGGPAMIRAAAKNHAHVAVVVDPGDYASVLEALRSEVGLPDSLRASLAAKAFARTSAYDAAIASYLGAGAAAGAARLEGSAWGTLRYGENPHQAAEAFVVRGEGGGVLQARQLCGKELSYNNIVDLDAAWVLARDLKAPGVAIVKHANPCGAAEADGLEDALVAARACDPVSAFGGIFAFNAPLDAHTARAMLTGFVECVIAPGYEPEALAALEGKKAVRVLEGALPPPRRHGREWKRVTGGFLVQDWDDVPDEPSAWTVATRRAPTPEELAALDFAWRVARHVKSNAILFAAAGRTLGVGAGQMSRVDAVDIAVLKARKNGLDLRGSVVASDAFFPFRDGLDAAAAAGATAVVQPGGSKRDDEVVRAADEHGMAMVLTGARHFRH